MYEKTFYFRTSNMPHSLNQSSRRKFLLQRNFLTSHTTAHGGHTKTDTPQRAYLHENLCSLQKQKRCHISLRWHYPNQVTGLGNTTYSQPAFTSSPLLSFIRQHISPILPFFHSIALFSMIRQTLICYFRNFSSHCLK